MPNDLLLRNISQSCQRLMVKALRSKNPNTMATTRPEDAHAVPEELVEALDQRVRVGRERSGRQPIGDDEVQQRKHHERAANMANMVNLAQHAPRGDEVRPTDWCHR